MRSWAVFFFTKGHRMVSSVARFLWGDVSREEFKKFGLLSGVFFFIIGTYWLMRSLKDAIFLNTVGPLYLPYAKIVSVIALILVLMVYAKLVDWLEKHRLVYLLCTIYSVLFLSIAYCVASPTIGLANTVTDKYRLLGWVAYFVIESAGTLLVALFWSFVASSVDPISAKRGYPIIIAGAQTGSILGAYLASCAGYFGIATLVLMGGISLIIVPGMIKLFMHHHPDAPAQKSVAKKQTGALEGLRLLLSKPYLMGILVVGTVYEIVGEILNLQMKLTAHSVYPSPEKLAGFLGTFGVAVNLLALVFAFVGTSFFIRRFGITFCLVMFPVTIACAIMLAWTFNGLWFFFGAMVALKGISYALNNPCKELMYIPTSKDIKFKAKSWMDGFGSRSSKAIGAGAIAVFPAVSSFISLISYGSVVSLGIIAAWIPVALFVGRTNSKLVQENRIIE